MTPQPITPDTNDGLDDRGHRLLKFINGLSPWNLHRGEEALNEYMLDTFMELIGPNLEIKPTDSKHDKRLFKTYNSRNAELRKAAQERLKP